MTAGIQLNVNQWKEWMQIQPSDNSMNAHDTRLSQDAHYRKVGDTEAVVNELGDRFAAYTRRAMQMDEFDAAAVESARAALHNGTLDTPENLAAAAENILTLGL